MNGIRKFLIAAAVITLFYGLYYWGIPSVINIDKRIGFIEQKIFQHTGYKVAIKNPYIKMGHIPAIWFMADNISVLNDDNSKAVNLEHSAIKIYLLPLLAGKIQIGNFSSDKIDVNLVYTKDSRLLLGQYPILKLPKSKMTRAYSA